MGGWDGRGGDCAILLFFFKRKTHEQKGLYFSSAKVSERGAFGQWFQRSSKLARHLLGIAGTHFCRSNQTFLFEYPFYRYKRDKRKKKNEMNEEWRCFRIHRVPSTRRETLFSRSSHFRIVYELSARRGDRGIYQINEKRVLSLACTGRRDRGTPIEPVFVGIKCETY